MASRFVLPFADVGNGISPSDGALLEFFISGTSTPKDTFTDEALTTPNTNPVVADGDGVFSDIWLPDGARYKVTLDDKNIVQKFEADPVIGGSSPGASSRSFDTVDDMVADIELLVGDIAETTGYDAAGDGGDNKYLARATTGGPYDGGSLIASTGNPAIEFVALFPGGLINFFQFGSIDNATVDSISNLQATFEYIGSIGGGEITQTSGSFGIDGIITVRSNTTLRMGESTLIKRIGSSGGAMFLNGVEGSVHTNHDAESDIHFIGGILDGNAAALGTSINIVAFAQTADISFTGVTFLDIKDGHHIELNSTNGAKVVDCHFEGFIDGGGRDFSEALQFDYMEVGKFTLFGPGSFDRSTCSNMLVRGCTFKDVGRGIGNHSYDGGADIVINSVKIIDNVIDGCLTNGMHPDGWDDVVISGNTVKNTTGDGLLIDDCANVLVSDNTIINAGGGGILNRSTFTTLTNHSITGNTIDGCLAGDGIDVQDMKYVTVSNNTIRDFTLGQGIRHSDVDVSSITGNVVFNPSDDGINIVDSINISVSGNTLRGMDNGITSTGDNNMLTVVGNTIFDPTTDGVNIAATTSARIVAVSSNTVIGAGGDAVQISNYDTVSVTGNSLYNTVESGIKLIDASKGTVTGNAILVAGNFGIYTLTNTADITISGNMVSNATDGLHATGTVTGLMVNANDFSGATTPINDSSTGSLIVAGGNKV